MLKAFKKFYDNPGPDEGWSWVIVAGAFLFSTLTFGIGMSGGVGILFPEFIRVFHATRSEATWPFATIGITQCFMGLSVGLINNVVSTRCILIVSSLLCSCSLILCYWATSILYITFTFGVLFGAGLGLANVLASVLICKYFVKYRSTANGIYSAGIPISGITSPFLINYLLRTYDLRSTMFLIGAITLHMMVASVLMKTRKPRNFPILDKKEKLLPEAQNGKIEKSATQVVKEYVEVIANPMFILITAQAIVGVQGIAGMTQTMGDYLVDVGISKDDAVIAIAFFSACDLIGRLSSGLISDKGFFPRYYMAVVSMFLISMGLIAFGVFNNFGLLLASEAIVGAAMGVTNNLINIFYCDYVGLAKLYTAVSLRLFFVGICGILRPLILGLSRDTLGSYKYYYFSLSAVCLLSSILWLFEPVLKRRVKPLGPEEQPKKISLYRLSSRLLPRETYRETAPQDSNT